MFKKGQLSIFILVALLLVTLLVILFTFSGSNQQQGLGDERKQFANLDSELLPIKDQIDRCLEKQLKRGLLIAGMKGGFIYDRGEYYGPSTLLSEGYPSSFIANLDLNFNSLLFSTLMYAQTDVFTPQLTEDLVYDSRVLYNHSIQEDLEQFVSEQFLFCLELDQLEEEGFDLSYLRYAGPFLSFDQSTRLGTVEGLSGEVGDRVETIIGSQVVEGAITAFEEENIAVVLFDQDDVDSVSFDRELSSTFVRNLEIPFEVNVSFQEDEVVAELIFPLTLSENAVDITYGSVVSSVPIRFSQLLDLASLLAAEKYKNRALDYTDQTQLNSVLSSFYAEQDADFLSEVSVHRTTINDSQEYKRYVYSLVDRGSRIVGNPFVFNFGYENDAPAVQLWRMANQSLAENSILVITEPDTVVVLDLRPISSDFQLRDNYIAFYKEERYEGSDARFIVSSDGIVTFEGFQEKQYSFSITLSDGEAVRTQAFYFIVQGDDINPGDFGGPASDPGPGGDPGDFDPFGPGGGSDPTIFIP